MRPSSRSSTCDVRRAGARSGWLGCWAGRPRRSGVCCVGMACHDANPHRARLLIATSTRLLASSCISISSSSGVSGRSASALGAIRAKRSRDVGWQYLHLAVDDYSRYTVAQLRRTQTSSDAVAFLEHALEQFAEHAVTVERIMSDNGSCYVSRDFRQAVERHDLRHLRTRPYTPR